MHPRHSEFVEFTDADVELIQKIINNPNSPYGRYRGKPKVILEVKDTMRYAKRACKLSSDGTTLSISGPCAKCKVPQTVRILHDDFDKYEKGAMIQDAFKDLTAGQREFLMSGYCDPCFESLCDRLEQRESKG